MSKQQQTKIFLPNILSLRYLNRREWRGLKMVSVGLLLLRLVIGIAFIGHGAQKLFGWFGGYGPKGTGGWMESIGMKPGVTMAVLAGLMELVGGVLFTLGLLTPLASALIIITMLGAIVKVHAPNGFWATANGIEFPLTLLVVAAGVALTGAGSISLDALWFN
jgi:putative oxidoreductase